MDHIAYSESDLIDPDKLDEMYKVFIDTAKTDISQLECEKTRELLGDSQVIHMVCGTVFWTVMHNNFQRDLDINNHQDLHIIQYLNDRQSMLLLFSRKLSSLQPHLKPVVQMMIDRLMERINGNILAGQSPYIVPHLKIALSSVNNQ